MPQGKQDVVGALEALSADADDAATVLVLALMGSMRVGSVTTQELEALSGHAVRLAGKTKAIKEAVEKCCKSRN